MKILLFCIDGASWNVIDSLIENNKLPNLSGLISKGMKGNLENFDFADSPVLWTSIATGKMPNQHGIKGFTTWMIRVGNESLIQPPFMDLLPVRLKQFLVKLRLLDRVSVRSSMRKCKSIWNMISEAEGTVGVVNWWVTYPAEEVNGILISDHANYFRLKTRKDLGAISLSEEMIRNLRGVAYPDHVLKDVFASSDINDDVLFEKARRFANLSPSDKKRFFDFSTFRLGDPLSILKFALYQDEFAKGSSFNLLSNMEQQPSFLTVYFSGLDGISHYFWKFMFQEDFKDIKKDEMKKFGNVLYEYYIYMDEMLGEFIKRVDDDTEIIVLSDHGFESVKPEGAEGPNSGTHSNAPNGILVMSGPNINEGGIVNGKITDLVPTILYLFGLPIGKDIEGRVLEEGIKVAFLENHPIELIDSWEGKHKKIKLHDVSDVEEKIKDRLRALGYID